ncbi:hypothetical protein Gotur_035899 [Gossypium turneri]
MVSSLTRLDNKHISINQLQMPKDLILQCHIGNLPGPPSPLIETYLRGANFLHVALVGRGCKLDPKLISALVERWRPETHTFHLSCGECTITLEDVHLQLGLPVDGSVVTGSIIYGGRIEMVWLRNNFAELVKDSTKERIERYTRAYILQIVEGILMPDKSQNLVHLRWLLKLVNFRGAGELSWGSAVLATLYREMCRAIKPEKIKIGDSFYYYNHEFGTAFHFYVLDMPPSHVGLPIELKDIQLLLDQRSEVDFEWTSYDDSTIREIISEEFFVNPNAWHVKISLVVYATVEMHEANRVLRQRQHPHTNRPRRLPSNSRGGKAAPSSSPTQEPTSTTLTVGYLSSMWYTLGPSHFPMIVTLMMMYRPSMHEAPVESTFVILSTYGTPHSYAHQQTPLISLFYQGSTSTKGKPRQPQPCPEAKPRRNPTRNHQPPRCGTNSSWHMH